ncbi:MAG: ArnT family glycosyltransferase [Bacteroidia bacterium]
MSKTNTINKSQSNTSDLSGYKKYFNLTKEEKVSYIILSGVIFIVVLIRSNFFNIPFERDEGAYGYYGKLLLEGKIPYQDFYEQKFPGIFYFYGIMVAIFGETVKGMHFGFMLLNIGTIILLFSASKRIFSPLAGSITAITYAIVSLTPTLSGFTIQSENGVSFFVSLGIYFYSFTIRNTSWKYYFLMGLAMGCAFMTKTTGVFLVLWGGVAVVIDFFLNGDKRTTKEFFRRTLLYSSAVFLVIGILFLVILMKGSWNEMIYWSYQIPKRYVSRVPWEDGKKYLDYTYIAVTKDYKFFWYHAGFALITLVLKNITWRMKLTIITLIGFSALTIFHGFYFYGHYWIQILPGLSILAGLTFYAFEDVIRNRAGIKSPAIKYIYVTVFIIATLVHLDKHKDYYFNPNYERILRNVYGNNPFPETAKIADYINANSKPEDNIVSIGSEPEIYFYTKKHCPSRHAYFSALVDNVAEHKEWQREFVRDVEKAKPRYVIFYNHPISLMVQAGVDHYVFDWYNKYVTENYNMIGLVDMIEGYSSNYVWKEQLNNYKPQAQNLIYIFERKTENPLPSK